MNKWQSVHRRATRFVMNLKWLRKQSLVFPEWFSQSDLLNYLCSVVNRGAAYLASTSTAPAGSGGGGLRPLAIKFSSLILAENFYSP